MANILRFLITVTALFQLNGLCAQKPSILIVRKDLLSTDADDIAGSVRNESIVMFSKSPSRFVARSVKNSPSRPFSPKRKYAAFRILDWSGESKRYRKKKIAGSWGKEVQEIGLSHDKQGNVYSAVMKPLTTSTRKRDSRILEIPVIYQVSSHGKKLRPKKKLELNGLPMQLYSNPAIHPSGLAMVFSTNQLASHDPFRPSKGGGMDLWVSFRKGDYWQAPFILQSGINTSGMEITPSFNYSGTRLYFASNGQNNSLGGYDLYSVGFDIYNVTDPQFGEVKNLGSLINSPFDEVSMQFQHDELTMRCLFSSNRPKSKGEGSHDFDLYECRFSQPEVHILVMNAKDSLPISSAYLEFKCKNKVSLKKEVDGAGLYKDSFPYCQDYQLKIRAEGYKSVETKFSTNSIQQGSPTIVRCFLASVMKTSSLEPVDEPLEMTVDSIMVHIKTDLGTLSGKTMTLPSQGPLESVPDVAFQVDGFNSEEGKMVTRFHSDEFGSFKQYFRIEGETQYSVFINSPGFGPVRIDLSSDRKLDTLVVLKRLKSERITIFYGYDECRHDLLSRKNLHSICNFIAQNPNAGIEIRSYTDSRGSSAYNFNLAKKRSEATAAFIQSKTSLRKEKFKLKALGESAPAVPCGADCSEADHQQNRRTEIILSPGV